MLLPMRPPTDETVTTWPGVPAAIMRGTEGHAAVDDAAQIDPDDPVEIVIAGVLDRPEAVHAGRVRKNGRGAPEDLLHVVGCGGIGGAVGDIEGNAMSDDAFGAQFGKRFVDGILANVGNDDGRAGSPRRPWPGPDPRPMRRR